MQTFGFALEMQPTLAGWRWHPRTCPPAWWRGHGVESGDSVSADGKRVDGLGEKVPRVQAVSSS